MAVPTLDAPLAQWSTNFQARGTAAPTDFSLTAGQMTLYTTVHNAWIAAYNACKADGARNKALVIAKNDAKGNLLPLARSLYSIVQISTTCTNENKTLIGVVVRNTQPSPVPPPAQAPVVTLLSVVGRVVRGKLADAQSPTKRHRPANAEGATIMSFAGATPPPPGDASWKLEGQTGQTSFLVQFDDSVAPGTPCWITALWYNKRGQYSPACEPVQTYLQIGPAAEAA